MALVFLPQYAGDQGESYQQGTDTAIRRFIVGRDNGSGGIDNSGAFFTPMEFYAQNGVEDAKNQARVIGNASFDRVGVTQYSPYSVEATVYQSNAGFYDLSQTSSDTDPGSVYNFTTRDVQFQIPFLTEVSRVVPGSSTLATRTVERVYTDTTPITNIDIEVEVSQWRFAFEVAIVNAQASSIHVINSIPYRFRGASSVRQTRGGDDPLYRVRYQWEFDIGSRAESIETDGGASLSLPTVFNNPNFSGTTFTGNWWRPPYCGVAIGTKTEVITTANGPVPAIVPAPGWFVDGRLGNESGWQTLPGNPIQ